MTKLTKELTGELQYIAIREDMYNKERIREDHKFAKRADVKITDSLLKKLSKDENYHDAEKNEFVGSLTRKEKKFVIEKVKERIVRLATKVIPEYQEAAEKARGTKKEAQYVTGMVKADERVKRLQEIQVELLNGL